MEAVQRCLFWALAARWTQTRPEECPQRIHVPAMRLRLLTRMMLEIPPLVRLVEGKSASTAPVTLIPEVADVCRIPGKTWRCPRSRYRKMDKKSLILPLPTSMFINRFPR